MQLIPDYLIYDEIKRRGEAERESGLQPLHLPLYVPELGEEPSVAEENTDERDRGVIIIDMNSWEEVVD